MGEEETMFPSLFAAYALGSAQFVCQRLPKNRMILLYTHTEILSMLRLIQYKTSPK